jgi:hypothetical protein
MKIRPVWAELFHADGRTNRQTHVTELIFVFRSFANTPKNVFLRTDQEGEDALFKLGASGGGRPTSRPGRCKQKKKKKR